jgi:hypothetical protein
MSFPLKDKVDKVSDVLRGPVDITWMLIGTGMFLGLVFVITGCVFLKNRENPFYHIQNRDNPEDVNDQTNLAALLGNSVVSLEDQRRADASTGIADSDK